MQGGVYLSQSKRVGRDGLPKPIGVVSKWAVPADVDTSDNTLLLFDAMDCVEDMETLSLKRPMQESFEGGYLKLSGKFDPEELLADLVAAGYSLGLAVGDGSEGIVEGSCCNLMMKEGATRRLEDVFDQN